jgi:hypothetical protein
MLAEREADRARARMAALDEMDAACKRIRAIQAEIAVDMADMRRVPARPGGPLRRPGDRRPLGAGLRRRPSGGEEGPGGTLRQAGGGSDALGVLGSDGRVKEAPHPTGEKLGWMVESLAREAAGLSDAEVGARWVLEHYDEVVAVPRAPPVPPAC